MKTFWNAFIYAAVIIASCLAGFFWGAFTVSSDEEALTNAKKLFNVAEEKKEERTRCEKVPLGFR